MLPAPEDPLRLSPLLRAPSGEVLEAVRKLGLEGVVGKRIDSIYEPGERSGAWIKLRTNLEQEFVIGGYTPGSHGEFDTRSSPPSRHSKLPSVPSGIYLRKGRRGGENR